MKTLLAIVLSLSALAISMAGEVAVEDAKNYIGESATVKGAVVQVTKGPKAVFLNFGGRYPNQTFVAVSYTLPFSALSSFEGKTVSLTGMIRDNNGKPEMTVTALTQIVPQAK